MEISEEQLAQIKLHVRVDHDADDELIKTYLDAAVDYVENYCDGKLVTELTPIVEVDIPPREILFTAGIWQSMLLLVGHWYANRESVNIGNITSEVPFGVDALLLRHRRWH
ncbi:MULTISPECIES: head-tail connector protein [Serratia]|uniref:head-tail connector protein n=1 Tax=Serratia TaxID=613 RepID=UPI0018D6C2B1|nr:phage gp6-like head-tail connector protein [Serratia marcescens]MDU1286076.1 head-tail connector protein [Serratia marcescens]MDU1392645.1 head-tail connector protein [Serratia marcescens]MDU5878046.1 head-tail connector protein [Serratia marcescens]HAU5716764.1 phage gp6-like head-tail connector protein [Serratia marcescens]